MAAYLIVGRTAVPVLGPDLYHGAQAGCVLRSVNNFTLQCSKVRKPTTSQTLFSTRPRGW